MTKNFLLAALLLCAAPIAAQDVEKEGERPAVETKKQGQAARASEQASKLKADAEVEVTYEQVLADPDNVTINYGYALTQVRRGDLKGAATTLERMLLVKPSLHRLRLLYSVVLYRLDNLVVAERELQILQQQKLPADLAAEAAEYLALVQKARKKNRLFGRLGVGFQYDTNRNAAPATGKRLFFDIPIDLTAGSRRRDDTSLIVLGSLEGRRALRAHDAFVTANYYRAEQTILKTINLQAYSLQGGAALRSGRHTLTPSAVFDHVLLAQSTYLRNRGFELRYDHKFGKLTRFYLSARDTYQDFVRTRQVPSADERDGVQLDFLTGLDFAVSPRNKLGVSLNHTTKRATKLYNQFDREGLILDHTLLLGGGTFLLSNATLNYDKYDAPDFVISRKLRRDSTMRLSAVYGAPLSLLHSSLKNLLATATYEYYHASSTIQNYAYTNNKISAMLTYKWDVGF